MTIKNIKDLTNKRFGRLIALKSTNERKNGCIVWECQCDCGNICYISSGKLNSNWTKSCGCLSKETASKHLKKYNKYDLTGNFGIGYTNKNEEFYFDLEDYDLIKNYCWYLVERNYVVAYDTILKKHIFLHSFLLGFPNSIIDHKDRNPKNNQKNNLRTCTNQQNHMNQSLNKRNTSGVIGVSKDYKEGKWKAQIIFNGKTIYLLWNTSFYDAIKARLKAEKQYFGEFAPQKHLFEEYGIEDN